MEQELSREEERNPAARRARLNSVLREINYLSPSWQEADYVPILDRAWWEEAMKNTETPAALPEEHPNAYKEEDGILIYYDKENDKENSKNLGTKRITYLRN